MNQKSPKTDPRQLILNQLRHPLKLRFILCLTMIGGWYFFFFMPLSEETEMTTARIGRERSESRPHERSNSSRKTWHLTKG